jgi:ATP-dependent helicase/nuclease subunit A
MINRNKIIDFLNSNLAERIRSSNRVNRETPFVLKHDNQLVQGIIDLYFIEKDKWVLIDFKTDFVTELSIHSVADNYRMQIEIYKKAIESLTGIAVGESYLYFIGIDRLYPIKEGENYARS